MEVRVRPYIEQDIPAMAAIWNRVVVDGQAFPQDEPVADDEAGEFFGSFDHCGVAFADDRIVGMYEIRPNNIGRCGHIANASYAVDPDCRNMHAGRALVSDSLEQAKRLGYRIMQFNAVVASNTHARHLYERLGFTQLGVIPGGFRLKDGGYADIIPHYKLL